jgi:hypothetical protein
MDVLLSALRKLERSDDAETGTAAATAAALR